MHHSYLPELLTSPKSKAAAFISSTYYKFCSTERLLGEFYTPIEEAVATAQQRKADPALVQRISGYLGGDVPHHFSDAAPIFYLPRFLATPNLEAQHSIALAKEHGLNLVIAEDRHSLFYPNELKRSLGKLAAIKGYNRKNDEIVEYFTLINFATAQGKPIDEITTKLGLPLTTFHTNLFAAANWSDVTIVDETDWVSRNQRDNIYEQYKRMLALTCAHGIMLESYTPAESEFFRDIVFPAAKEVEDTLGLTPLVVEHITSAEEVGQNWNAYPQELYAYISKQFTMAV